MSLKECSFIILVLFVSNYLTAQSLTVEISKDTILLGNQIGLTYQLKNTESNIEIPILENCKVSGPSISSEYQNINGEVTKTKSFTYYLTPTVDGEIVVESVSVDSENGVLFTDSITITVLPNPQGILESNFYEPNILRDFYFKNPFEKSSTERKQNQRIKSKRKRRKI